MKGIFIATLVLWPLTMFAQSKGDTGTVKVHNSKQRIPSGYMGLWDLNVSSGYIHNSEHHTYTTTDFENTSGNAPFVMIHIQESVLSNYVWATQSDKKVKFGVTETLDLGSSYSFSTKSNTSMSGLGSQTIDTKSTNFGFLFAYEAGAGVVYKISNDMDAGITYYALALSTFMPNTHYAKFRFRYTNYMCELSAFGKTGLDLKYMKGSKIKNKEVRDRESSSYFGVSISGHHEDSQYWNKSVTFVYFNFGFIF